MSNCSNASSMFDYFLMAGDKKPKASPYSFAHLRIEADGVVYEELTNKVTTGVSGADHLSIETSRPQEQLLFLFSEPLPEGHKKYELWEVGRCFYVAPNNEFQQHYPTGSLDVSVRDNGNTKLGTLDVRFYPASFPQLVRVRATFYGVLR